MLREFERRDSRAYASFSTPRLGARFLHADRLGAGPGFVGGAHLQAALLLSGAYVQKKDETASASGFGLGAMLGGGYELWIGEQWSLGPLARLTVYSDKLEQSGSGTNIESTLTLFVPSVLIAATYH